MNRKETRSCTGSHDRRND